MDRFNSFLDQHHEAWKRRIQRRLQDFRTESTDAASATAPAATAAAPEPLVSLSSSTSSPRSSTGQGLPLFQQLQQSSPAPPRNKAAQWLLRYRFPPQTRMVFLTTREPPVNMDFITQRTPPTPAQLRAMRYIVHVTSDDKFCIPRLLAEDSTTGSSGPEKDRGSGTMVRPGIISWRSAPSASPNLQARAREYSIQTNAGLMLLRSNVLLERLVVELKQHFPLADDIEGPDAAGVIFPRVPRWLLNTMDVTSRPALKEPLYRAVRDLEYTAVPIQAVAVSRVRCQLRGVATPLALSDKLPPDTRQALEPILIRLNEYRAAVMARGFVDMPQAHLAASPPLPATFTPWSAKPLDLQTVLMAPWRRLLDVSSEPRDNAVAFRRQAFQASLTDALDSLPKSRTRMPGDRAVDASDFRTNGELTLRDYVSFISLYESMHHEDRLFLVMNSDINSYTDGGSIPSTTSHGADRLMHTGVPHGVLLLPEQGYGGSALRTPIPWSKLVTHEDIYPARESWINDGANFPYCEIRNGSVWVSLNTLGEVTQTNVMNVIRTKLLRKITKHRAQRFMPTDEINFPFKARIAGAERTVLARFYAYSTQPLLERDGAYLADPLRQTYEHFQRLPQTETRHLAEFLPRGESPPSLRVLMRWPCAATLRGLLEPSLRTRVETAIDSLRISFQRAEDVRDAWGSRKKDILREKGITSTTHQLAGKTLLKFLTEYNAAKVATAWEEAGGLGRDLALLLARAKYRLAPERELCVLPSPERSLQFLLTPFMTDSILGRPLPLNTAEATEWTLADPVKDDNSLWNLVLVPHKGGLSLVLGPSGPARPDPPGAAATQKARQSILFEPEQPIDHVDGERDKPAVEAFYNVSLAIGASCTPFEILVTAPVPEHAFPIEPSPLSPWAASILRLPQAIEEYLTNRDELVLHEQLQDIMRALPDFMAALGVKERNMEEDSIRLTQDAMTCMTAFYRNKNLHRSDEQAHRDVVSQHPSLKATLTRLPNTNLCLPRVLSDALVELLHTPQEAAATSSMPATKSLVKFLKGLQQQAFQRAAATTKWNSLLRQLHDPAKPVRSSDLAAWNQMMQWDDGKETQPPRSTAWRKSVWAAPEDRGSEDKWSAQHHSGSDARSHGWGSGSLRGSTAATNRSSDSWASWAAAPPSSDIGATSSHWIGPDSSLGRMWQEADKE